MKFTDRLLNAITENKYAVLNWWDKPGCSDYICVDDGNNSMVRIRIGDMIISKTIFFDVKGNGHIGFNPITEGMSVRNITEHVSYMGRKIVGVLRRIV